MLDEATALVDGYTSYYSFSRKRAGYSGSQRYILSLCFNYIECSFKLLIGVATYCKNSCTPHKAEEGLTGTLNGHNDQIDCYDNVHSSFTDDELRDLDAEGRCVMTLHKFKAKIYLIDIFHILKIIFFFASTRKRKMK